MIRSTGFSRILFIPTFIAYSFTESKSDAVMAIMGHFFWALKRRISPGFLIYSCQTFSIDLIIVENLKPSIWGIWMSVRINVKWFIQHFYSNYFWKQLMASNPLVNLTLVMPKDYKSIPSSGIRLNRLSSTSKAVALQISVHPIFIDFFSSCSVFDLRTKYSPC